MAQIDREIRIRQAEIEREERADAQREERKNVWRKQLEEIKARAVQSEIERLWQIEHPLVKTGKMRKAIATNTPCHADCWHATGDTCQCSCAGRNHGIGHEPTELEKDRIDKEVSNV